MLLNLKSLIQIGAGFSFFLKYIFIQPLYVTNPESFLWVVRQKSFKIPGKQIGHLKKGVGAWEWGWNLALRRQVVTQGNWTHSRTLKPIKQTGAFFFFNQPYIFFLNFENFYLKKITQKHRLLSLQYVVCCIFQFVQCFKAQGCLYFQLYMSLKHPSFWQAGRRLNKNQNRNKAD